MPNVGPIEIIIVLLILVVIFGPKRIPDLGRSVGQGMRNFKQSVTGRDSDDEPRELEAERRPAPARHEGEPVDAEPVSASAAPSAGSEGSTATAAPTSRAEPTRDAGA